MALSKSIKHCRRCIIIRSRRSYTSTSGSVESNKMQSRTMSVTQWKILNQLKDYFSKLSYDKSFQNSVNKEFAQLLQKFQPSVYGNDLIRHFETPTTTENNKQKKNDKTESGYLPSYLNDLKIKISSKEVEIKEPKPKWKTSAPKISKSSISARTRHVVSSIVTAETHQSKLQRIEELSEHIKQYPEVKNQAVKEGAVRLLLRIKNQSKEPDIQASVSEALALLGHCNPLPSKGIRILSIDGGGIRGLLVIEMLRKLEELSGKRIHELFDFICGVSTGAIIACSIVVHLRELDMIAKDYREISTKVFTQSPLWGTSNLVWSHSYYDTALWEKMLQEHLGDLPMIKTTRNPNCPKLAAVSAIVNHSKVSAYVFRNYSLPWRVQSQYMGDYKHKVWEAARASAAAPTYFEEFMLGNLLHQDGGILVNNPTAVAVHEAKLLWPGVPIQCVVSFGTGRTVPVHPDVSSTESPTTSSSSWTNKFKKLLDSATDTEGVHTMLNDLLPDNVYYRFNPYLTEMLGMTEIDPKKLEQLERDALMYLRRNEDKFQEAVRMLCETKSPTQKALDWLNNKKEVDVGD